MLIENARQMHIIVSDFQPQSQNALNQKLQTMVHGLQEVDKLKSQFQDVQVPPEVLDYIDQGRNPKLYTKNCIEKALAKNEQVKGKIDAYQKLKKSLIVELEKIFPNEISKYKALRYPNETRHMFDVELNEESQIEDHTLSDMAKLEKDASDETPIFKIEDNLENDENMRILNTNATEESEGFKCNGCAETFVLIRDFNAHVIKHLDIKSLENMICGLNRKANVSLNTQEIQYQCKICHKAFSCSSGLSEHVKTHSDDRPHECSVCNLRFECIRDLHQHQKEHFKRKTKKQQYSCNYCNQTYSKKGNLKSHMTSHAANPPFECTICNASFNRKSALNTHRRFVHHATIGMGG
ncbi:zinc finger protein 570 isoform X2 [Dendroctonus ponderosae]|nr:zinc finger protein 570 isoform X2 [Dendroctonus ponderosae]